MFGIILIGLLLAVFAIFAIGMGVFVEVALAGPQEGAALGRRPAQALGASRSRANGRVQLVVSRSRETPSPPPAGSCHRCPMASGKLAMVPVTAPEALAMADYLRRTRSPEEVTRLGDRAAEKANQIASGKCSESSQEIGACALLEASGVCAVDRIRPVCCSMAAARQESRAENPLDVLNSHAHDAGPEVNRGVCEGLQLAGLDGGEYELNSALAAALRTPEAARRWARGEGVFAQCHPCETSIEAS